MKSRRRLSLPSARRRPSRSFPVPRDRRRTPRDRRRSLVILVIDQMRFDYLDRYATHWQHGLKRLRDEGAIFERGFYPVPEHGHVRRARDDRHWRVSRPRTASS